MFIAVRTGLEPVTPWYGTRTRDPMRDRHVF